MLRINEVNRLYLGVQGENNARTIEIDVNEWIVANPNATVSIWHKRNGDATPSPTGAAYDPETGIISWTLTNTDTYVAGEGLAEVRLTENGVIKKTGKIITGVSMSVTGAGTPLGSDWQSYIDLIEGYKDDAQTAQGAAEDAAEDAEDSAEDAEAWAVGQRGGTDVEDTDPAYHNNSKYYAQQAGGSATDAAGAKTAAETAQGKAEAAQGKAEAAQGKTETAQEKAETAQGKAEDAQEAAETAQGKAEDAQEAAEAARNQYPKIDDVSGNWMTYDPENEEYVDTGVHAQGETGATGATGQTGPQGPTGAVPNLTIGTVTTLQPGSDATVERRSGSPDTAPVFDFGIPEGEAGEAGETGATPDISIGTVTTLQPDQNAYVELDESSTAEAPVFNFGIPKGETGQAGNVYGNTIDMSSSDSTKVSAAINAKAAKVSSATSGNFAGLDSNGDLTDSGSKAADFIAASTKGAASGVAELNSDTRLADAQNAKGTVAGYYTGKTTEQSGSTHYHILKFQINDYTQLNGTAFPVIFRSSVTVYGDSGFTNKLKMKVNDLTSALLEINGINQISMSQTFKAGIYWVYYDETNSKYRMRSDGLSAGKINGKTIGGAIVKDVDTSISAGTSSTKLPTSTAVDSYVSGQISGKADKVSGATSGNFAGLDGNGNLTDSGHKHSDYLTSHQDISGKADKVSGATNGNFAGLDANGNLTDSGKKASDFATVNSTLREVPVAVAVADWTLSSGVYSAEFTTAYVTSTSKEWLVFDDSYKTYAKESVTSEKKSGGGGIILQTTVIPTGTITGTLSVIDADDGKVPVLIEDTVTPIANGGTGQSSLAGAKQALGITELNTKITTQQLHTLTSADINNAEIIAGGYYQIGSLVIVEIRINKKLTTGATLNGLPKGLNSNCVTFACMHGTSNTSITTYLYNRSNDAQLIVPSSVTDNTIRVTGCYIADNS